MKISTCATSNKPVFFPLSNTDNRETKLGIRQRRAYLISYLKSERKEDKENFKKNILNLLGDIISAGGQCAKYYPFKHEKYGINLIKQSLCHGGQQRSGYGEDWRVISRPRAFNLLTVSDQSPPCYLTCRSAECKTELPSLSAEHQGDVLKT